MIELLDMGQRARSASKELALTSTEQRNLVLKEIAGLLIANQDAILAANQRDVEQARENGLSDALLDRLLLTPKRLEAISSDVLHVTQLPDPVGETFADRMLENGLRIYKQRVPIGVLGVIYEARPNVTIDITSLAIKSGNAAILRGGSETINSNRELVKVIQTALSRAKMNIHTIQFMDDPDRQLVQQMLRMYDYIDLIIPRGGAGLHKFCKENSLIPVIVGGMGICHLYVDETANQASSLDIIYNAKVQRPSVCNALDTVLINSQIAEKFIPLMIDRLRPAGVMIKVEKDSVKYIPASHQLKVETASENDFDTEWMALVLGVRVVNTLEAAIEHIAIHSTGHSDGILSEDQTAQARFIAAVDSAAVYVNASTRFTDGGQFGLGAEVAVSTQKIHARGPMALEELTSYKWIVIGNGQVRPD